MNLTKGDLDNLVTFLKGLMHAGHADGRGCLPLPGISCNTCKDLDGWVDVLNREEPEREGFRDLVQRGLDTCSCKDPFSWTPRTVEEECGWCRDARKALTQPCASKDGAKCPKS